MEPVSPVFPTEIPPEHAAANTLVPIFTPRGPNQFYAPGMGGGANTVRCRIKRQLPGDVESL